MTPQGKPRGKAPRILDDHKQNFETLKRAFNQDSVALVDCYDTTLKQHVAVICTVHVELDGEAGEDVFVMTPFAMMYHENPYDRLIPPADEENYPND